MSITGLARSPGTEVLPMWNIRTRLSPSAASSRAASCRYSSGQRGS